MSRALKAFRSGLKRELPRWRDEGLVDGAAAEALAARYALGDADLDGPGLLPVYVLGAVLVGAGVVSLVAWHWDEMGRAAKLALIAISIVAAHVAGDRLRSGERHPKVGEALALLGSLLFGAGIGLVAQIFQVSGQWYGLFGAFAVGAAAAALLLDSEPTLLAASAAGVALWASGFAGDREGWVAAVVPWAAAAPFVAAGWRRGSRAVLAVTAAGLSIAVLASAENAAPLGILATCAAFTLVPVAAREREAPLAGTLATIGRLGFAAAAFAFGFIDLARDARLPQLAEAGPIAIPAVVAATLLGLAPARGHAAGRAWSEPLLAVGTSFALALMANLGVPVLVAVVANVVLALLAAMRISEGVRSLRRGPFWEGVLVAFALVVARFLEIEQLLWLKGLGFIASGVGLTLVAVAFERRRKEGRHGA